MSEPALVGVDWGTSSFRAWLLDRNGAVLARQNADCGILRLPKGSFEACLREQVGHWLDDDPTLPILLSGMVTSRQGWLEVPYRPCPIALEDLAAALVEHRLSDGRSAWFVPGLVARRADGLPDVLRGEETQILGALAEIPTARTLLLPGTHSKWAKVKEGIVESFVTFLTGELFAILKDHSTLGLFATGTAIDDEGFEQGVRLGLANEDQGGGSFARLFLCRSCVLAGELSAAAVSGYLSGLLIGSELREACAVFGGEDAVVLVGESALVARYARALELAGRPYLTASGESAARGQYRLAARAGLLAGGRP